MGVGGREGGRTNGLELIMGSKANERPKKTASKRIHPDRQTSRQTEMATL